jgi:serine/threonine-protein phosphatase with EF-hands
VLPEVEGMEVTMSRDMFKKMDSLKDTLKSDDDLSSSQLVAIKIIQRLARQKKAFRSAIREHQWKIFADFDTRDEAEMLHLAVFMQSLLDNVPDADGKVAGNDTLWEGSGTSVDGASVDGASVDGSMDGSDILVEADSKSLEIATIGDHVHGDYRDYDVGKSNITKEVAMQIIEVYRKDGRLSVKLVMKLLRTAYRMLKQAGNISRIDIPEGCKMTIVGDIHGQLPDLLYILDESGMPANDNRYIFNGDFVDRGQHSVECICILLALYASDPQNVVLNRGNHEDIAINRVYGFQAECVDKYGELAYGMFCEVFRYLPLFVVANDDIFVVHAGLFHDPDVAFSDLEEIDRLDYVTRPTILYPENTDGMNAEDTRKEYLKQLQRDALWSDPMEELGVEDNPRGAGVCFGPDVAGIFMQRNNLSMIIRSHECVRTGFCLHYLNDFETNVCPPGVPLVCTIFSASNYCNGDNFGAYITILPHKFSDSQPVGTSGLYYAVHRFKTSSAELSLEVTNKISLSSLIVRKKNALRMSFQAIDKSNSGQVSKAEWADVMLRVTGIKIRWLAIMKSLVPPESLALRTVDYVGFLDAFTHEVVAKAAQGADGAASETAGLIMMDAMYVQRKKLETIFYYFDTDGNGVREISLFFILCARVRLLNQY